MNVNYFYKFYQFDYVKEEIDIFHPSCWGGEQQYRTYQWGKMSHI